MHEGDESHAVAKATFILTMIGVALYAGAVIVFIL